MGDKEPRNPATGTHVKGDQGRQADSNIAKGTHMKGDKGRQGAQEPGQRNSYEGRHMETSPDKVPRNPVKEPHEGRQKAGTQQKKLT